MRQNFGPNPYLYPMPVLIVATYGEDGTPNAQNVAWGCIGGRDRIALYISPSHKTMKNVLSRKAFTVSVANAENMVPADYVGIVSGNKEPNKMEKTGWHLSKSAFVDAPLIDELPMALECELVSYDEETHLLIGAVKNVCAEESILTNGQIDPAKLQAISYDPVNHKYIKMGEAVGNAFADGAQLK